MVDELVSGGQEQFHADFARIAKALEATSAGGVAFRAYHAAIVNTGAGAFAKTVFTTEDYDIGSNYDAANSKFVAPVAGYYAFSARIHINAAGNRVLQSFYKNGVEHTRGEDTSVAFGAGQSAVVVAIPMLLAANDYVEVYNFANAALAMTPGTAFQYFSGYLIGQVA